MKPLGAEREADGVVLNSGFARDSLADYILPLFASNDLFSDQPTAPLRKSQPCVQEERVCHSCVITQLHHLLLTQMPRSYRKHIVCKMLTKTILNMLASGIPEGDDRSY